MVDTHPTHLSPENPWPGLASFSEDDRAYFHGRETEAAELFVRVRSEPLAVVFGRSGLGKTSLLNAGLFPLLREEDLLPVYVRLDYTSGRPLREQILTALSETCRAYGVESPPSVAGETLWEFFHRLDAEFWSARNRPVVPVLVFDQFEEMFTIGQADAPARERAETFAAELGELIENRVPLSVKAALEADDALGRRFDFRSQRVKIVLSFREDFLAEIEGLSRRIPSLVHNRFRLKPMTGAQAFEAVRRSGGQLLDENVARRIIGLTGRGTPEPPPAIEDLPNLEIDPALLSVVCSELNAKRQRAGAAKITADLLEGAEREILLDFYERGFTGLDPRVRVFVEDNLLTASGFRNSYARDDALAEPGITPEALNALVARRLVREDERLGVRRLELTHDILTRVVRDSRETRKTREAEAAARMREQQALRKQRQNHRVTAVLGFGVLLVGLAGIYVLQLHERADELFRTVEATRLLTFTDRVETSADRALLLAVESYQLRPSIDAKGALLNELMNSTRHVRKFVHAGPEHHIAVSPNAAVLASLNEKGAIVISKTDSDGRPLTIDAGAKVEAVTFSPDATLMAVTLPESIAVWRPQTGQRVAQLERQGFRLLAFSADGAMLALGRGGALALWDIGAQTVRESIQLEGNVGVVAFSPDGSLLAAAIGRDIRLYDARTLELVRALPRQQWGHQRSISSLHFGAKGEALISGSEEGAIVLWQLRKDSLELRAEALDVIRGHESRIVTAKLSPDGSILASAGADGVIILFDVVTHVGDVSGEVRLRGHKSGVASAEFSADGRTLVSTSVDGALIVWNVPSRAARAALSERTHGSLRDMLFKPPVTFSNSASPVGVNRFALAFAPDGKAIATRTAEGVAVWDLAKRQVAARVALNAPIFVGFVGSGKLVVADAAGSVMLADPATRDATPRSFLTNRTAYAAALTQKGDRLALRHDDSVTVLDLDSGSQKKLASDNAGFLRASLGPPALAHDGALWHMNFSPDGRLLAVAAPDKPLAVWDAVSGTRIGELSGQMGARHSAFSPDNKTVASADAEGGATLWDAATLKSSATLRGHRFPVNHLAFSPDGMTLVTASQDGTLILWGVVNGTRLATLEGHTAAVLHAAFSPDGKTLASAGEGGFVMLWEIASRLGIAKVMQARKAAVSMVMFSPDGNLLASAGADETVGLWDWNGDALTGEACRTANRNLTCGEWRQYIGERPYRKSCPALPAPEKC